MGLAKATDGTTAALTIGAETTLSTQTTIGVYVLSVNVENLADGDRLHLRIYDDVLSADADRLRWEAFLVNKQGDAAASAAEGPVIVESPPITVINSAKFTIEQEAGTGRTFKWRLDRIT
ncbi:MAG TPA: hypothetical protein VLA52_07115 [Thermohalobaculum sp.]|nr:hypothetical protein [Thermohalobaculum sp.]